MSREVLTSLVGPILVALVTLTGAWSKEAAQRRGREQVRQRTLAYVKDEISVIEAWIKACTSLEPSAAAPEAIRVRARQDLDIAYERMRKLAPEDRQSMTIPIALSRLLLRHVKAVTPTVRWLRYLYLTMLLWAVFVGLTVGADIPLPNSAYDVGLAVGALIFFFVLGVVPAWLASRAVYFVARRAGSRGPT